MKTIKVLLTQNVENLGIVGDVVRVKPGYARNLLLPRGWAIEPTEGNVARLAQERAEMAKLLARRRAAQEAMLGKLEGFEITLQRSANEQGVLFGGVSAREIADALNEEGFEIEERAVRLHESIKRLDSYEISIVLANDLKTVVKLWVVSDKPSEELEPEGNDAPAQDIETPGSPRATQQEIQAQPVADEV
ncbi:MAG: 50S ribosomal protein L9 [Planctomycetaceae bacterium]|nr:50S ribosomal protein L9 [Planctomycetaceae bacterium]